MPKKIKSVKKSKSSKPKSSGMTKAEKVWIDGRSIQALKDEFEEARLDEEIAKANKIAQQWDLQEMQRVREYHEAGYGHILDLGTGKFVMPQSQFFDTKKFLDTPTLAEVNQANLEKKLDTLGSAFRSIVLYIAVLAVLVAGVT